ncbi:Uncharacterised protein [Legionella wadsworthii]|uniref:Uncharacterized protein n=1 Tax=Legionella wadsworthii TaxID=28088 RepID=A0A378M2D6_9GAMM|nr:Uncharacterised protein [Legionella wadsworthii]
MKGDYCPTFVKPTMDISKVLHCNIMLPKNKSHLINFKPKEFIPDIGAICELFFSKIRLWYNKVIQLKK